MVSFAGKEFGEYTSNRMNKTVVLTRISKAYDDVINMVSIDAKLVNLKVGEHALAIKKINFIHFFNTVLVNKKVCLIINKLT